MNTKLYDISNWCKQGPELENYPYIGEIDVKLNISEIVQIGNDYFAPGVLRYDNNTAGVRKIEIDFEPEDKNYESNLKCPYCGYEDNDSCELSDDDEEHECSSCGATMSFERVVTVDYSSSPVKPPTVVKANWI